MDLVSFSVLFISSGLTMADEVFISGAINGDDQTNENFYDLDRENDIKIAELTRKVGVLEQEKADLIREYDGVKQRVEKLTAESEEMKSDKDEMEKKLEEMMREIERSESDKKALDVIGARAVELETEVSRLQHDLISASSEADEANAEVMQLKRILEEKELRVENLEKEKGLIEKEKGENESRLRDLEEKIRVMEVKESKTNEEKIKIEQETKEKIDEKEREISNLKSDIEELKASIEHLKMQQKQDEEMRSNELKEALRKCNEKAQYTESALDQALEEARELKVASKTLQDTQYEGVNGIASDSDTGDVEERPLGFKWQVAIFTGAITAAAAVCYLRYRRQR